MLVHACMHACEREEGQAGGMHCRPGPFCAPHVPPPRTIRSCPPCSPLFPTADCHAPRTLAAPPPPPIPPTSTTPHHTTHPETADSTTHPTPKPPAPLLLGWADTHDTHLMGHDKPLTPGTVITVEPGDSCFSHHDARSRGFMVVEHVKLQIMHACMLSLGGWCVLGDYACARVWAVGDCVCVGGGGMQRAPCVLLRLHSQSDVCAHGGVRGRRVGTAMGAVAAPARSGWQQVASLPAHCITCPALRLPSRGCG